jgi:hypothetical protein
MNTNQLLALARLTRLLGIAHEAMCDGDLGETPEARMLPILEEMINDLVSSNAVSIELEAVEAQAAHDIASLPTFSELKLFECRAFFKEDMSLHVERIAGFDPRDVRLLFARRVAPIAQQYWGQRHPGDRQPSPSLSEFEQSIMTGDSCHVDITDLGEYHLPL